jgi:hypothetical protein
MGEFGNRISYLKELRKKYYLSPSLRSTRILQAPLSLLLSLHLFVSDPSSINRYSTFFSLMHVAIMDKKMCGEMKIKTFKSCKTHKNLEGMSWDSLAHFRRGCVFIDDNLIPRIPSILSVECMVSLYGSTLKPIVD